LTTPRPEEIPEVADDEQLIRHLDPKFHWDPKQNRPNSGAFRSSQELSFDREEFRAASVACGFRPSFGFARLAVAVPRGELHLDVHKDPLVPDPPLLIDPDPSLEYNPGHAVIVGADGLAAAKAMRDAAVIVFPPGECQ
jgi:hypothetical protein